MTKQVDFDKYEEFVDAVTSDESKDFLALSDRLVMLDEKGANIERLLTAGVGLNAEAGEFLEIIKKIIFQGKPPKIKPLINSITEKIVAKINTVEKFFSKLKNEQIKVTKP